ncbi:MAG: hypothetical protein IJK42_01235 [Prevotella sp.]|nr:hypothetical protein [Prevotella sp.]
MQNRHREISVISVVAAFTLAQLLILCIFGYTPYTDSEGYIILAQDSLKYGEPYPVTSKINELAFIWNVGSINTVALSMWLFHSIYPLLITYSLMKGVSSWLVYAIAKDIFNERMAWISLILYVIYPANYGEGTSLLSETPFMFFILSGLCLSLKKMPFMGGILLAIANWYRPMAIIFLLSLIIYLIILYKNINALKPLIGYVLTIGIIGGLAYHRTGHFIYQAKTGWMSLMQYSWDHDPNPEKTAHLFANNDPANPINPINPIQKDKIWQSNFLTWLKNNPKTYLMQMSKKFMDTYISDNVNFCTFLPDKYTSVYMYEPLSMKTLYHDFPHESPVQILAIVNLIIYYLILLLAIVAIILLVKEHLWHYLSLPMSVITLGTLLLMLVGHGEARFHIPFMPFFIILAACSIHHFRKNAKRAMD